jgi:L-ascorbate metabolism protein UlaG (beta-lactamase superfamily)
MLKITYIGHSCFILDDGTYRLIIDPFITNNSLATVNADDIKVDYVVLTHAHGDHIGDTFEIAKRCNALVICINEIGHYLDDKAIKNHFRRTSR